MNLKINHTDEHNDYFLLTDDKGNEYPWHGRKGVQQDPEKVMLLILKRQYPNADFSRQENETELEPGNAGSKKDTPTLKSARNTKRKFPRLSLP